MLVHIAIEGNIASGKSTVIKKMNLLFQQKQIICKTFPEPIFEWTNFGTQKINLLDEMYKKPYTHSFLFQLGAMITKAEQLHKTPQEKIILVERSIQAQEMVFIPLLNENKYLSHTENEILTRYSKLLLSWSHLKPTIIIYLKVSPKIAKQRLILRGRSEEKDVSLNYLNQIGEKYEIWLKNKQNVIEINADNVKNLDSEYIFEKIKNFFYKN